jgi:hypothetical protein
MTTQRRRDLAAQAERPTSRQLIWQRIRKLGAGAAAFTFKELYYGGHEDKPMVERYLRELVEGGFVAVAFSQHSRKGARYVLVQDVGVEAPRVTRGGRVTSHGRQTEQLWQTIRHLPTFTARDLAINASTDEVPIKQKFAANYIAMLLRAGYLQLVERAIPAAAKSAVYRLFPRHNSGPKPPIEQRVIDAVWDPNLGKIVWHREIDA